MNSFILDHDLGTNKGACDDDLKRRLAIMRSSIMKFTNIISQNNKPKLVQTFSMPHKHEP